MPVHANAASIGALQKDMAVVADKYLRAGCVVPHQAQGVIGYVEARIELLGNKEQIKTSDGNEYVVSLSASEFDKRSRASPLSNTGIFGLYKCTELLAVRLYSTITSFGLYECTASHTW